MGQKITIEPVTRVEGHGKVTIHIDNNGNIMVGAFFLGNFLVSRDGRLTPLKGQFRGADAVEQDSKGNYYVSSWSSGAVWKIDGKSEESMNIMLEEYCKWIEYKMIDIEKF